LFNLDVQQSHPVRIEFSGAAAGGKGQQGLLTADRVSDTNEPEEPSPQVTLHEQRLRTLDKPSNFPCIAL